MDSGCEAGWLLPGSTGTQNTNYKVHIHTVSVCHFVYLSFLINHAFHWLFISPNCSFFMSIISHSCTFLHAKPLDIKFGSTFLLPKRIITTFYA